ncbi:MAG: phage tail assembly protein, partial [bacterium]|nr:phage tail assembly protein [bacterium]
MALQTEYEFNLPKGYVDEKGALHRGGTIRLASASDEIL